MCSFIHSFILSFTCEIIMYQYYGIYLCGLNACQVENLGAVLLKPHAVQNSIEGTVHMNPIMNACAKPRSL